MSRLLIRRGNKADLPALNVGEPGFATDTKELFIGASGGNASFGSIISGGSKMQSGGGSIATVANGTASVTVTFTVAFANAPVILIGLSSTVGGSDKMWISASAGTPTSFIATIGSTVAQTTFFQWIAIGS